MRKTAILAALTGAAVLFVSAAAGAAGAAKLKVALTFDDLPRNGTLPAGAKDSDFARDTI